MTLFYGISTCCLFSFCLCSAVAWHMSTFQADRISSKIFLSLPRALGVPGSSRPDPEHPKGRDTKHAAGAQSLMATQCSAQPSAQCPSENYHVPQCTNSIAGGQLEVFGRICKRVAKTILKRTSCWNFSVKVGWSGCAACLAWVCTVYTAWANWQDFSTRAGPSPWLWRFLELISRAIFFGSLPTQTVFCDKRWPAVASGSRIFLHPASPTALSKCCSFGPCKICSKSRSPFWAAVFSICSIKKRSAGFR